MNVLHSYRSVMLRHVGCSSLLVMSIVPRCLAQAPVSHAPIKVAAAAPITLLKPTTPTKAAGADGFLQRWLVLEPIPANGLTDAAVQRIVKKDYFPDQFSVIPHDGDKVSVDGATLIWHALDTRNYNFDLYHFAKGLDKPTSNVLFWAVTIINAPQEMQDVRVAIGSNAASVTWLNGNEVVDIYGDRQTVIDDGVSQRLTLNRGPNVLRIAVVNGGGATDFCARFLDANDKPIKGLTLSLGELAGKH